MIVIPSGHGGGLMIMLEFICIPLILENGITIHNENIFGSSLLLIILFSLIGKTILLLNLWSKRIIEKRNIIYFGLTLMLFSFVCIVIGIWKEDFIFIAITIGSGIPFLIYLYKSIILINTEPNPTNKTY